MSIYSGGAGGGDASADGDLGLGDGGLGLSGYGNDFAAAGDFIQGIGAFMQGEEKQEAYDYNAGILNQMADQEMVAAGLKVTELGEQETQLLGTQKEMYAVAGVTQSGSPTDVALQTATNFEFDKLVTTYNAQVAAQQDRSEAALQKFYGKEASRAGVISMGTDLLKGAGAVAGIAMLA